MENWDDKEYHKEYHRRYYLKHKAKFAAQSKAWAKAHPDKVVAATRKWKFGLTREQQEELLSNPCAICGGRATHIDHCHKTGLVRGGLCGGCNSGLGFFKDNPDLLDAVKTYLKKKRAA